MTALPIMITVLCVLVIGYRYYSVFLETKVLHLNDDNVLPSVTLNDGHNYHPTKKWVLFGHHFAAISGAGPLIGPVLAAQFGYLPGLLWLLVGVVLAGAVQDFIVLTASMRRGGKSLAEMIQNEIGVVAGIAAGIAILFVLVIALSGLGIVVVNALAESAWGCFTIATTIPIALFMGFYAYRIRIGHFGEATVIGVALLFLAVIYGREVAISSYASYFIYSKNQITIAIAIYGFTASVLPVWLLLCPRDYLSSFMKIGTILLLVIGVIIVNPEMKIPALTPFINGGGPIIPGKVFPFVFITIMCGSISGFHALVASGTTPKMISKESHARPIGYGAMLIEGLVGIVALIAVCNLSMGDYLAVNVSPEKFKTLNLIGYHIEELPVLEQQVEEKVAGRTGGAVSLALGMAKILSRIPGVSGLMAYWYHFAIMFEALFILTTIDTGTRIARFVLQEFIGKAIPRFGKTDWVFGTVFTSFITVSAWSYFIYTGSVSTIWPMFGIANQLLAAIALSLCSVLIYRTSKPQYVLITLLPLIFVLTTTLWGAYELCSGTFWNWLHSDDPSLVLKGYLDLGFTLLMVVCLFVVLIYSIKNKKAVAI